MFLVESISNKYKSKMNSLKRKHEGDNDKKYKILKLIEDCKYITEPSKFDEVPRNSPIFTFNKEFTKILYNCLKVTPGGYNNSSIERNLKFGISFVSKMEQFYLPNIQETSFHSLSIFFKKYEDVFLKEGSLFMEGIFDDTSKLLCVQQYEKAQFIAIFKDILSKIALQNLNRSNLMYGSNSRSQLSNDNISEGFTSLGLRFNSTYKVKLDTIISTLIASYLRKTVNFIELANRAAFSDTDIVIDIQLVPGIEHCRKHRRMNLSYAIKTFVNTECNTNISSLSVCFQHGNVNIYSAVVKSNFNLCNLFFDTLENHTKYSIEKVIFILEINILKLNSQNKQFTNLLDNEIKNALKSINESCLSCNANNSKFELRVPSCIDSENTITQTQMGQNIRENKLKENSFDRDLGKLILNAKFAKCDRINYKVGKSNERSTNVDISNRNSVSRKDFVHIIDEMSLDFEKNNTNNSSRNLLNLYKSFSQININFISEQLEGRHEMRSNIVFEAKDEVISCFFHRNKLVNKTILNSLGKDETLFCDSMYIAQQKIAKTFCEYKLSPLVENAGRELGNLNYSYKAKSNKSISKVQSFVELRPQNYKIDYSALFLTKLNLKVASIPQSAMKKSKLENKQMLIKPCQISYGILRSHHDAQQLMNNNFETDIDRSDDTSKHIAISNEIHSENGPLFSVDFKNILRNQQKSLKSNKKDRRFIQDEPIRATPKGSAIEVSRWNIDCNDHKDTASQTEAVENTPENYEKYSDLAPFIRNWSSTGLQKCMTKQKLTPYLENNNQSNASYPSEDNCNVREAETKVHLKERKLFSADTSFTSDQMLQENFIEQQVPSKTCFIHEMDTTEREHDMYYAVEEKTKKCDLKWESDKSKVRMGLSRKQRVRPLHPYLRN